MFRLGRAIGRRFRTVVSGVGTDLLRRSRLRSGWLVRGWLPLLFNCGLRVSIKPLHCAQEEEAEENEQANNASGWSSKSVSGSGVYFWIGHEKAMEGTQLFSVADPLVS